MSNATQDTTTLVTQYINTCNAAMQKHRDDFPFRQLMRASERMLGDKNIGVGIYKDDPEAPFDFYTIKLRDGHFELVSHGKKDIDITWKAPETYLEKVVRNPDEYISHPSKLDFDWLRSRVGLS